MRKEFVPYEESLKLKELGFDEETLCLFNRDRALKSNITSNPFGDRIEKDIHDERLPAPLYQQVFRWFRDKYNLSGEPQSHQFYFMYQIIYDTLGENTCKSIKYGFESYEESEVECLRKLIEIVCTKNVE